MDISIIIPTKNRLLYLKKLINYYENENFQGKLIIADSSDKDNYKDTKFFLEKKKIKIEHFFFDGNEVAARENFCHQIQTKYVAQSGDDDFYCVDGLKKIIEFLDSNKNYNYISGYGYVVSYDVKKNTIKGISEYSSLHSEKNSPLERINEMTMRGNVSDYVICRKEIFQKIFKFICFEKNQSPYLLRYYAEWGFKLYKFLFGKSKELNIFFIVRFRVPENSIGFTKTMASIYRDDRKSYFKTYYVFMKKMTLAFRDLDDKNRKEIFLIAKNKIKQAIYEHTFKYDSKKNFLNYLLSGFKRIKNLFSIILFKFLDLKKKKIDLMINKDSKFYNHEFKKIIKAMLN